MSEVLYVLSFPCFSFQLARRMSKAFQFAAVLFDTRILIFLSAEQCLANSQRFSARLNW